VSCSTVHRHVARVHVAPLPRGHSGRRTLRATRCAS
jgi:hypothetical protein